MTTVIRVIAPSGRRGITIAPIAVAAGWPSPAQDYFSGDFDLNEQLIQDVDASYIVRVSGDSMLRAGISHGDELIVDRSITAKHGDVVVAILDGEMTIKRLEYALVNGERRLWLRSENPNYPDIHPSPESDVQIWGVATFCLHHLHD
ncbi:MAG: translesion error-prone DNA polymerase V autoproteolytic subunit [Microbacteriaceae bacterium]